MALRSLNNTLKTSLINNDEFNYAHLVKFEKPTINEDRGETSKKANTYTYITDGAFDIVYDDGSTDEEGNANGAQTYLANKLEKVGSVTETVEAKASSMSISLDTASLGASATSLGVNFASGSITVNSNINLVSEGFREGDKIKFTVLNGSGNNNAKTVIIKNFTAANVFTYTAVDTITANNDSAVTYKIDLISEELTGVISDKLATTYQTYLNREVFVYKAHFDPITNAIIGEPYLLFKGIISGGSISEDPTKTSRITWTLTSHWGDFSRVSGRLTVDEQHRALDSAGIPDPDALVREDYAGDFGFMHANQAINVMALYNATETSYKQVDINGFWFGGKRLREVESTVQRRVDLGFNLTPKYLPVVYGIRKVDSIPVFVDTDNTDPSKVYVAYAICEGQVASLLDLYVDGTGSVCVDKADFDLRSGNTDADLTCKGRMDRGDALQGRDITESTGTTDPNLGEDISDLTTNGDDGSNSNDFGVVESNTPTPSFGSSTDVGDPGVLHEQYHKLTSPITATYIFHAGKPDQDADPLLVSKAASTSFKIQNDYFTGTKEYWGPSHRLLDTAYVVAEYTIADGETSIPELDFIVRGKGIKCFNYDSSYAEDTFRNAGTPENNFDLGDLVTLKKTSDNSVIASSVKIIDKWTFIDVNGETERRFRLSYTSDITENFYMQDSGTNKFYFTISTGAVESSATLDNGRQMTPSLSGATIAQNQVSSNNAGLAITLAGSEATSGVEASFANSKTISFSGRADLLKRSIRGWSYDADTNILSNVGAGTMSTLDSGATGIVFRDTIILNASNEGDNDYYNGYGIILKRFDANGVPHIQQRRIVDYIGAHRLAVVDFPWDSGYAPADGDTYILSKGREDIRVSTNPALQLLDYLTNNRYGRGLDIDNDINLDTFKEAARQCDTQSDVTVVFPDSTGVAVDDVYKYAVDNAFFEGTVSSITSRTVSSTTYDEVTFTNVIGKLGRKFVTWKSRELGELVWNNGNVYKATGTQNLNQSAPTHTSGTANNLAHQSTVTLTKVSGSGASTVNINISLASANGNPLVKSFVGTDFSGSGYSLYDADDVKYWKYIGWDSNDQRNVTRHQMNQLIATSNPIFDNINLMLNQFNGILRYSNGKYELAIRTKSSGTFVDPEIINESDIIGSISLKDGGLKKSYNSVNTSIVDPQTKFEARSVSFFNSDYLKEDRNIPKQGQYGLPGITNYYNARYNINQRLDESRFGLTISFKMMPKGALLLPGNLIRVNYPRFGYENKEFRITNVTTNTDCLINVTADEHNDSAFTVKNLAKPRFGREIEIGSLQNKATVNPPTIGSGSVTDSSITIDWSNGTGFNAATDKTQIWARTGSGAVPDSFLENLIGITLIATVENGATTFVEAVDPDSSVSRQYWLRHVRDVRRDWSSSSIPVKVFSNFHASASSGGYQQTSPAVFFPRDINGQIFYVRSSTSTTAPSLPSTKFYNFSIQAMVETSGGTDKLGALDPDGFDVWLNELPANTTGKQIWAARFHGQETTNVGTGTISVTVEPAFLLNDGTSIDTSLTSLTNNKLNLSGGTLTGDLTVPNLDVLNSGSGNATVEIKSTSAGDPVLQFDSAAANRNGTIKFLDNTTHIGRIDYVHNGDRLDIQAGSATGATISVLNNRVIIGDTGSHTSDRLQIETPASGGGQGIQLRRNDANGDQQLGRIDFGNNTDTDLARIAAKTDGDSNAGDSGALLFSTQVTSGSLAERMRITSTGKVLFKGAAQTGYALFDDGVNGGIHLKSDTSSVTTEYITTGFGAFEEARFVASNFVFKNSGTSTRAVIDTSGNFLVGTTNTTWQTVEGLRYFAGNSLIVTRDSDEPMSLNRLTNDGDVLIIRKDGTANGSIGVNGGDVYIGTGDTNVLFADGSDSIIPANTGGASRDNAIDLGASGTRFKDIHSVRALIPKVGFDDVGIRFDNSFDAVIPYRPDTDADSDDRMDLGRYNARWDDVFATNGTIQTSDQDEKQDFEALSDAEKRVAVAAKGLLKKFRWKSAVTEKGDNARIHFGIVAQELEAAFTAEGLDAGRYGMFISNTWTEDGIEKTRRGVRYHELLAFIIASI